MVDSTAGVGKKVAGAERQAKLHKLELHWDGSSNGVLRARSGDTELWVARHSKEIVENGWEPFDQPSTAAYVPLGLRDMKANVACEDGGRVLIATWGNFLVSQDDFAKIALAAEVLIPAAHKQLCLAELERAAKAPAAQTAEVWLVSTDEEVWPSCYDERPTKAEAIAYGREEFYAERNEHRTFYVGRKVIYTPPAGQTLGLAERAIDDLREASHDEYRDEADWPKPTKEQERALDVEIGAAVDRWVKTLGEPDFFLVRDVEEVEPLE